MLTTIYTTVTLRLRTFTPYIVRYKPKDSNSKKIVSRSPLTGKTKKVNNHKYSWTNDPHISHFFEQKRFRALLVRLKIPNYRLKHLVFSVFSLFSERLEA